MIPKRLTREMLIGKKCEVLKAVSNKAGSGLAPGAVCTIKDVVRGKGISIQTDACPCCGQYAYITRVSREDEERFDCRIGFSYSYFEIIQRLFLWGTNHSGGTSAHAKCMELGVDAGAAVDFSRRLENEEE